MHEKTTKYRIIKDPIAARLEVRVQDAINGGWQPHGSPFVAGPLICQPMIYCIEVNHDLRR